MNADEWRGDSIEDLFVEIGLTTVIARMEAGHGQIALDRMEYHLFQGEEYRRTFYCGIELIMLLLNKIVDSP